MRTEEERWRRWVDLLQNSRALRLMHEYPEHLSDSWVTERQSGYSVSNDRELVNDELERIWKEAVKVFSTQLSYPALTKENKDSRNSGLDSEKKETSQLPHGNVQLDKTWCPATYAPHRHRGRGVANMLSILQVISSDLTFKLQTYTPGLLRYSIPSHYCW